jgi:hypothetical protein
MNHDYAYAYTYAYAYAYAFVGYVEVDGKIEIWLDSQYSFLGPNS